ncbi:dual oxidase-like [Tigriopus californicus]|uniref:dual oxidase-like n=1 Tax=Tigriopus californicus TaxID=6832 RepID=UPI0027D9F7E0|nr:dual oxidase-like [Tigriopus californicus]
MEIRILVLGILVQLLRVSPLVYGGIFDFDGPIDVSPSYIYERQRFDGWFNNMAHPDWGSIGNRLTRKTPASYTDGVYMMAGADRPSPRKLSESFMKGEDGLSSRRNRTALLAFFGQLVTAEILMASENGCPLEIHKIEIDKCDEMYDEECQGETSMPFYRANYDPASGQSPNSPREQINRMTTWIDGSFIYSHQEAWVSTMRSFQNGSLKWMGGIPGMPPYNVERVPLFNAPSPHVMRRLNPERMFVLGDPRTNQNPAFLTLGILFYRWHNVLAERVQKKHPNWRDEDVFQAARRLNIATLQSIIAYEYVPAFLGKGLKKYEGYKPDMHPGISHVFQSAAFRYGHTMIPPGIYRRDGECHFKEDFRGSPAMRLCSTWWDAQGVLTSTNDNKEIVEDILRGLSSQISEREDSFLCSDVRNKLFGPMDFSRRDLASINIMRGRDNGLPDYNTVRKCFNLPMVSNWSQINPTLYQSHPELFEKLAELYGSDCLTNIDLYIGGMLESNEGPGPLFGAIIQDQFERLRDSDRFWFENADNGIFTQKEIDGIRSIKLWDVIVNASSVKPDQIQKNVFFWMENDPCEQPAQLKASSMPRCEYLRGHDAFQGSEAAYLYGIVFFLFFPVFCACAGYGLIKLTNSRRRRAKSNQPDANCFKKNAHHKTHNHLRVREWMDPNKSRPVRVLLGPEAEITLTNRKSDMLRKMNLASSESLMIEVTRDVGDNRPMILMKVPQSYDLVLEFDSELSRKRFLMKMESFISGLRKSIEMVPVFKRPMLAKAETKERRQKKLEHFFREAYALTFGLKEGEKKRPVLSSDDSVNVMRTALTRDEFANALGMRPSDIFVNKMFKIVDKDQDERISFQEFLDTVVLFSTTGRSDDKVRIIFDMCDTNENGVIEKTELQEMLISLVEMAKTEKVLAEHVDKLIDSMFETSGFEDKEVLTYEDFKSLMKDFNGDFLTVGLDCKGAKHNFLDTTTNIARMQTFAMEYRLEHNNKGFLRKKWDRLTTFLEENRQHIFYLLVFFSINVYLFTERFIHYSIMSEHADLRHIMGVGIAITRGCAAALSFDYSILLLSMSRNLLTKLKESSLHQYIPIDSHLQFHKICACTALFFSFLHSCGHLVNFYQVATQPLEHLSCLSPEVSFPSDQKPSIPYWLFQTLTGLTGILLYSIVCIIFMFAHPIIRRKAYRFFWLTHQLYVLFYILCLLHGLQRITSVPRFWVFFIFPGAIFIFDKIESLRRSYMELDILDTEILPSDVIKITFYRPPNFTYRSGQWIRVSCNVVGYSEYHSLTITSAPHEDFLSIHIKARGPWTWRLRNYFDSSNIVEDESKAEDDVIQNAKGSTEALDEDDGQIQPRIRLQGPFGGGNQEWYKFEVAVMIGAGIGVTPYASILNDLVFGTSTNRYSGVACKKVYFLWITPSHRTFEWFMDVLRDVEQKDVTNVLEMHIFITQFFHKYDLRTTMLYICENHFQRLSRTSLFTNLKAANHFGRPDMASFLRFVQRKHSYVSKVGVFSCGPNAVTKGISAACEEVNRTRKLPYFSHHFENFC